MRSSLRLRVAMPLAALTLAASVATASASTYQVGGRTFKLVYSSLEFDTSATEPVKCAVTLEGSFESASFSDTRGTRIGSVTRTALGTCTGGTATLLTATLPWSVTYDSFTGRLPAEIETIALHVVGFAARALPTGSVECLARTTAEAPLVLRATREGAGEITSARTETPTALRLEGSFLCSLATGTVSGTSSAASPDEEANVIVSNEQGGSGLIERASNQLVNVTIRAGMVGTLEMLNRTPLRDAHLTADPVVTVNGTRFISEPVPIGRCVNGTNLHKNRGLNACAISIRVAEGTPAGTQSMIRIEYDLGLGVLGVERQTFMLTSS